MAALEGTGRHPSLPAGTQTPTRCRSAPSRGVGDDKHASATRLTGAAASVLVEEPVGDVAEAVTVDGDRLAGAEAYDEHDHWKLRSMGVTVARTWPRHEPVGGRLRWGYLERDLHDGPLARGRRRRRSKKRSSTQASRYMAPIDAGAGHAPAALWPWQR
jgi:hypothetical protein